LVNISAYSEILALNQALIFGLSVNNLFDSQYFDHLSTLKPMNYYNQGRNISLSLKIPFGIK
jgi:iron complex outermembrane recepter protein